MLKGLVGGGLVARKIARFENKLKMFYKPTGLGLRLFEVLDDVAIPKGRAPPEPRAGVAAVPAVGAGVEEDTSIGGEYVSQPKRLTLRNAVNVCRPWRTPRGIRNRAPIAAHCAYSLRRNNQVRRRG